MIDRSKTLARSYVANWYDKRIIKTSAGHALLTKVQNNQFVSLDAFVLYAVTKYNISYEDFPADFQTDIHFLQHVINKSNNGLDYLVDIAKSNKTAYVRVLEDLSEFSLTSLMGEEYANLTKNKKLQKLRKLVNAKIAEEKTQQL